MGPKAPLSYLRRGAAVLVGLTAMLPAVVALMFLGSGAMIEETITHSREIQDRFLAARQSVEDFRLLNQRFPSTAEVEASRIGPLAQILILRSGDFRFASYYEEAVEQLGMPDQGSYFLAHWRGEWMEYYAVWSGRSTLVFDPTAYYVTGSQIFDVLASLMVACLLGIASWRLWPSRR